MNTMMPAGTTTTTTTTRRCAIALLEGALEPGMLIDESGFVLHQNEAARRLFVASSSSTENNNISSFMSFRSINDNSRHMEHHENDELLSWEKIVLSQNKVDLMGNAKAFGDTLTSSFTASTFKIRVTPLPSDGNDSATTTCRLYCMFLQAIKEQHAETAVQYMVNDMLEASLDPILLIDDHGIIQLVNEAAVSQFGYQKTEFLGNNISMIVGADHAASHDQYIQRYLETGEAHAMGKKRELMARRKDGTEFPIELGLSEFRHEGKRLFCGFLRDLSELKRREMLVLGILEASMDPILQIDDRGIIQMVNEAAVRQFGYQKTEFLGNIISMIVGGGHAANHDKYIQRYIETGEAHAIGKKRELMARRKDGSEFPIELGLSDIHHEGDRRFCGFIRDMTRQKQDEQELKRREEFTNSIIEAAHDALFVTEGMEKIVRVNAASTTLFGWSREEFANMTLYELLAPDFAADQKEEFDRYIREATPLTEKREVTGLRKDGSVFPLLLGSSDVEGPSGQKLFALFSLDLSDQKRLIQAEVEKHAADVLLKNVLPDRIADRLKVDPAHIAEYHASATILFADIVGFTTMSSKMEPSDLVRMLNELFVMFDELVDKYDLNKIKTIGDCYMVASVPAVEHPDNDCTRVCHFALDMLDALARFNKQHPEHGLNLRVGINEGPVVAGVVGTKRFVYDLWGDTVNLASRMESTGVPGKIQVTKAVSDLAERSFVFHSRGMIMVKGKGELEAFVLERRTKEPRFSVTYLDKREQIGLERERKPSNLRDHLRFSIADISKSMGTFNSKDFRDDSM